MYVSVLAAFSAALHVCLPCPHTCRIGGCWSVLYSVLDYTGELWIMGLEFTVLVVGRMSAVQLSVDRPLVSMFQHNQLLTLYRHSN